MGSGARGFEARSSSSPGGLGLSRDVDTVHRYFAANGARCGEVLLASGRTHPDARAILRSLHAFMRGSEGDPSGRSYYNKLFYYCGHGSRTGTLQIGRDQGGLSLDDFLHGIADCPNWCGLCTVVIDACYAGRWVADM